MSIETQKISFSVADAASMTTLSKAYLWNEIKAGNLKASKIGRRVLILRDDLMDYLKKGEIKN